MYNRYAPQEGFQPLEPAPEEHPGGGSPLSFLQRLLGNEKNAGGGGILDLLGLGKLDTGDILLLLAGEAAQELDLLPLERDLDLIQNVLFSGIWVRYSRMHRKDQPNEDNRDDQ